MGGQPATPRSFPPIRLRQQRDRVGGAEVQAFGLRAVDDLEQAAGVGDESEVEVEIAPNVKVRVLRGMISDVRSKGEPVKEG